MDRNLKLVLELAEHAALASSHCLDADQVREADRQADAIAEARAMFEQHAKREKLVEFARFVLLALEAQSEWNSDTLDCISNNALVAKLAKYGKQGQFAIAKGALAQ